MTLNPQLFAIEMPIPFVNEMLILARDGFQIDKILGHVDPSDSTLIFLQQTTPESQLRCRTCHSQPAENAY
ncbi:hypothetical protein J5N97_024771 [Dioscorea zingiberensis]|uniref:Uncharacterized protein n=1 Tax=Dioscorea zingiberensis TaxID=325984 RepID=A0A9D5C7J4_9LILI|nr:hypothetical protein J5N97_024771 [Dioscorea zingiberensis]